MTIKVNATLRLVLVTGGPGAGKTTLTKRLYWELPKNWRFVPLDNFIEISFRIPGPEDWPEKTVRLGTICMDYWRKEKVYCVLVEGVIQSTDQVEQLCRAFGVGWPSSAVRLIHLKRTALTHRNRREAEVEWNPPLSPGMTRDEAFRNLEDRVPLAINGEIPVETDMLTKEQVFERVAKALL